MGAIVVVERNRLNMGPVGIELQHVRPRCLKARLGKYNSQRAALLDYTPRHRTREAEADVAVSAITPMSPSPHHWVSELRLHTTWWTSNRVEPDRPHESGTMAPPGNLRSACYAARDEPCMRRVTGTGGDKLAD